VLTKTPYQYPQEKKSGDYTVEQHKTRLHSINFCHYQIQGTTCYLLGMTL